MTIIREANVDEGGALHALVAAAFGREPEAALVDQLTGDGDAEVSLVAETDDGLIGHVLFSRMVAPFRALALAPVSVAPGLQGQGVGAALIRSGIERARGANWRAIFVLGSPVYYGRFGFDAALAAGFTSNYASPAFMVLPLTSSLPQLTGDLRHARAFAALDEHSTRLRGYRDSRDLARDKSTRTDRE